MRMNLDRLRLATLPRLLWMGLIVAAAAAPMPAAAQGMFSVEVTPLRVELKLTPGATHTQAVTLKNDSKDAVRVRARVDDWYLSKDGTPQFKAAAPDYPYSASAWIRLNPPEQLVKPGATAIVRFTTTVPAGAKVAGYRCAVMFEFDPPDAATAAKARDVMFRGRVATLLYATVGAPAPAIDLTDLQPRFAPGQPPAIVATLNNTGRVQVRTKGTMIIYDQAGTVVRQLQLPNVPVLPESEREVSIPTAGERDRPLPPGTYRIEVKFDLDLTALVVGETTLEIPVR
jgi:P pilus assembly chaperone PapD